MGLHTASMLHAGVCTLSLPDPLATPCAQAADIAMLADMARYMQNVYTSVAPLTAADFPHANLPSLYWWSWNANSGDTGGLVEDDWVTVRACTVPHHGTDDTGLLRVCARSSRRFPATSMALLAGADALPVPLLDRSLPGLDLVAPQGSD